jgi:hypothetical protein
MNGRRLGAIGLLAACATASTMASAGTLALQVESLSGPGLVTFFRSTDRGAEPVLDYTGRRYAETADGELVWVASGPLVARERNKYGAPIMAVSELVVGSPAGELARVRSALCGDPSTIGLQGQMPCDHGVHRVLGHARGLLIAGRIIPAGRTFPVPWLAAWSPAGLTEIPIDSSAGLDPQVFDLVEGRSGVLVLGSSTRSGSSWGAPWWAVYRPDEGTLSQPVLAPSSYPLQYLYPAEESWRAAVPLEQGGWLLVLPRSDGGLELFRLGPDGAIEAHRRLEGPSVELHGPSFGRLFASSGELWLVSGRHSYGAVTVRAWRIDPDSGGVLSGASAALPPGFWVHATRALPHGLLLGGARSTADASIPTVVTLGLGAP